MTDCAAPRHDAQDEPTPAAQHGPGGDRNDCIQPPAPHAPHGYQGTDAIVPNAAQPYWSGDGVTLYHGDCREIAEWFAADVLVTDPPYPNNSGHFDTAVPHARQVLAGWGRPAVAFWIETERPPIPLPLVAVHIWHRTNVNGRPYEAAYQFDPDGVKRRSTVIRHPAINDGATGSTSAASRVFAVGHPTQKPIGVMETLIAACPPGVIADPFAGSGSTLVAARNQGRRAIGIEISERYCELAARRLDQGVLTA